MKRFSQLHQQFGFTPTEGRIILFLIVTFLIGGAIKYYNDSASSRVSFDYSREDSLFAARSKIALSSTTSLSQGTETDSESPGVSLQKLSVPSTSLQRLNINTASRSELVTLPGVGEAMADRILLHRRERGAFRSANDLLAIKGIGKKKLERIAPLISFGK